MSAPAPMPHSRRWPDLGPLAIEEPPCCGLVVVRIRRTGVRIRLPAGDLEDRECPAAGGWERVYDANVARRRSHAR